MIRKIIRIDEEKCTGCGICAEACHEGAIDIVDGKARLTRESFCDGFGDCLPECPTAAISFEEREAPEYDESAVHAAKAEKERKAMNDNLKSLSEFHEHHQGGCPGAMAMQFDKKSAQTPDSRTDNTPVSRLLQWPVQIKLAPPKAPFYANAKLLIAADCTAYAYADMHERFMKDKITLIGCPKLDDIDYTEKLAEIIGGNDIKSVTVVRMEVPCCGGLQKAAENALKASGKFIPWSVVTIARDGRIIDQT